MPRIWLPLGKARPARDEREAIILELRQMGVHVAHAYSLPVNQLREILHWQKEKAEREAKAEAEKPVPTHSKEEVRLFLRDYTDFLRAKRENRRRIY